jgi:carboxyl-terminal processing protease
MLRARKAFRWTVICTIVLAAAFFGPGVYRGVSDSTKETYKELKIFSDVIDMVQKNYVDEVESKKLIEDAIQGMVGSLDPHSSLLTPEAFKELQIDTHGEFTGIGIHVTMRDNLVTVISPIEGTPAYNAGIQAGDKIIKVDGMVTEDLQDAVKRMRGPRGTPVKITIIREGEAKPLEIKLVRDLIPIDSVKWKSLESGYGYVWVTHFRDNTYDDLVKALDELESGKTPLKGLVLDLRDNPGGVLDQALRISDLFLDKGIIMTSKGRLSRHTRVYQAHDNDSKPRHYPVVVLINGGSASASEIVAGALQDQKRALVIGTTSFGKGSVQSIETLRDGYALKLTIARYYTPSGRSIQAKGVEPDIVVKRYVLEDQEPADQVSLIKEKDLINHLGTEGLIKKKLEEMQEQEKANPEAANGQDPKEELPEEVQARLNPLDPENLLKDSQVRRALDILISYDIFQKMQNG